MTMTNIKGFGNTISKSCNFTKRETLLESLARARQAAKERGIKRKKTIRKLDSSFDACLNNAKGYKNIYQKALEGRATPKDVFRAKCAECNGFESVIERTRDCTVLACPLWCYRPYQDIK